MSPEKTFYLETFGCQMNAHDSERIKGMLEELGFGEAPTAAEADVVVFNTCTIREKPDQRMFHMLDHVKGMKRRNPEGETKMGHLAALLAP